MIIHLIIKKDRSLNDDSNLFWPRIELEMGDEVTAESKPNVTGQHPISTLVH